MPDERVVQLGQERPGVCDQTGLRQRGEVRAAAADLSRVLETVPKGRNAFEGLTTQRVYALFA